MNDESEKGVLMFIFLLKQPLIEFKSLWEVQRSLKLCAQHREPFGLDYEHFWQFYQPKSNLSYRFLLTSDALVASVFHKGIGGKEVI